MFASIAETALIPISVIASNGDGRLIGYSKFRGTYSVCLNLDYRAAVRFSGAWPSSVFRANAFYRVVKFPTARKPLFRDCKNSGKNGLKPGILPPKISLLSDRNCLLLPCFQALTLPLRNFAEFCA